MDVKLQIPEFDENTPGILDFIVGRAAFYDMLVSPDSASYEQVQQAQAFFLSLIAEPKDRKKAKAEMGKLSLSEMESLLTELNTSVGADPKV